MVRTLKLIVVSLLLITITSCRENTLKIHVISDIHYAPRTYYEYTGKFKENNDSNGTGKQIKYQEEIIDAYINEELELKPDYIIITGDLVFSGHKNVHKAFVEKFNRLIENGIKVLVIPGNHDFDYMPFVYKDDTYIYDTMIISEFFEETYNNFGYADALNKDENSLSYSYKLDNKTLLIALDTIAKYGNPDGNISDKTLMWINDQLQYAKKHNLNPLIVGHHNALIHNNNFDIGYRLDNSEKLVSLMNEYEARLYLSGHMHIQDIEENHGITEILNESFSLYPHRYGEIIINGKNYSYNAKSIDVAKYQTSNIEELKEYDNYGKKFISDNFIAKSLNRNSDKLQDNEVVSMLEKLNDINVRYFIGEKITSKEVDELNSSKHKELISSYIKSIEKHTDENNLSISGKLK